MDDPQKSIIAGMFGGFSGVLGSHSFDTIKSRIQSQGTGEIPLRYYGVRDAFTSILQKEGLRGLYKGALPPFFGQGVINAIVFGVENYAANYMGKESDSATIKHLKTGMTAGFAQVFVCSPMELVKLHTQHQKIGEVGHYKGNWATLKKIYKMEGLSGCYRGITVTMVRDVTGFGVYFATYEGLMDYIARRQGMERSELGFFHQFVIGGFAGVASWACNYPVDIAKTRFQLDGFAGERQYTSSVNVLFKDWKQGGIKLLYRGITPCLVRAFLFNSFTFPMVEFVKKNLQK